MAKVKQSYSSRKTPFFVLEVDYNFARDGGAIGTLNLGGRLPNGSKILTGVLDVTTAFTGATATGRLDSNASDDLVAATVVTGAPFSTTGLKSIVPVGSGATMVKMTADRNISFVIGTAAVTAGAFKLTLLCSR